MRTGISRPFCWWGKPSPGFKPAVFRHPFCGGVPQRPCTVFPAGGSQSRFPLERSHAEAPAAALLTGHLTRRTAGKTRLENPLPCQQAMRFSRLARPFPLRCDHYRHRHYQRLNSEEHSSRISAKFFKCAPIVGGNFAREI